MSEDKVAFDAEEIKTAEFTTASQGRRFINYLIDIFGYYIFAYAIGLIIGLLLVSLDYGYVAEGASEDYSLFFTLLGLVAIFFYYFIQEAAWGKTLGKVITGTKVVDENGNKPSAGVIAKRTLCRFIPFEPFSFLTGNYPIGWHDKISKTRVVQKVK